MAELGRACEVVIVDDGSTDGSFEQLQELAQTDDADQGRAVPPQFRPDGGDAGRHSAMPRAT